MHSKRSFQRKLYEVRWQEGRELIPPLPTAHPALSGAGCYRPQAVLTRPVAALILYNLLGGSTPPYRLRGLGRHASRLCRPGHHRGYEVSVTRVAND